MGSVGVHGSFIDSKEKGSVMNISGIFAMGGGYGQGHAQRYGGCSGGCDNWEDDPRVERTGIEHIIGGDGSGLSGLL